MNLYLIHCGFYDPKLVDGTYESHVNLYAVAESFADAKNKAKQNAIFKEKKMHVDGIQLIEAVNGYRIHLEEDQALKGKTLLKNNRKKDIAGQDFSV